MQEYCASSIPMAELDQLCRNIALPRRPLVLLLRKPKAEAGAPWNRAVEYVPFKCLAGDSGLRARLKLRLVVGASQKKAAKAREGPEEVRHFPEARVAWNPRHI